MKLQAKIGRGDRNEEIYDSVGTICGGIRMANHITRQSDSLDLQDKEGMDMIKYRTLSETSVIDSKLQTNMAMVKNIEQDHKAKVVSQEIC